MHYDSGVHQTGDRYFHDHDCPFCAYRRGEDSSQVRMGKLEAALLDMVSIHSAGQSICGCSWCVEVRKLLKEEANARPS